MSALKYLEYGFLIKLFMLKQRQPGQRTKYKKSLKCRSINANKGRQNLFPEILTNVSVQ